jgi:hypothetical protein
VTGGVDAREELFQFLNESGPNSVRRDSGGAKPQPFQNSTTWLPHWLPNREPETRTGHLTCKNSVELRGFEPLTPSMRTRCATGLRYSPENL